MRSRRTSLVVLFVARSSNNSLSMERSFSHLTKYDSVNFLVFFHFYRLSGLVRLPEDNRQKVIFLFILCCLVIGNNFSPPSFKKMPYPHTPKLLLFGNTRSYRVNMKITILMAAITWKRNHCLHGKRWISCLRCNFKKKP